MISSRHVPVTRFLIRVLIHDFQFLDEEEVLLIAQEILSLDTLSVAPSKSRPVRLPLLQLLNF